MSTRTTRSGFPFTQAQDERRERLLVHAQNGPEYIRAVRDNVVRADNGYDAHDIDWWLTHAEAHLRGVSRITRNVETLDEPNSVTIARLITEDADGNAEEILFRVTRALAQGVSPNEVISLGDRHTTYGELGRQEQAA